MDGSSDNAEKSIDRLIKVLDRLQAATERCTGLTKLKNQIDKLSSSIDKIKNLNSASNQISSFVASINQLSNIKTPNLSKLSNQMEKLSEISRTYSGITMGSNSLGSFVSDINSLSNINVPNLTKLGNQMTKLRSIADSLSTMPNVSDNIGNFVNAIKPFETLGKNNVNSFLRSLEKLPEVAQKLNSVDLDGFSKSLSRITSAITPLANAMDKLGRGYSALPSNIKKVVSSNEQLITSTNNVKKTQISLSSVIGKAKIGIIGLTYAYFRISDVLSSCLASSNEYVENLNLFTVAMGDSAKAAYDYAEKVNSLLGIDISEWIRNQGVFKQITTGFGVVEEKANLMSKNLTQLGYDISSFFNISTEESMQKLQSGISGELEPLRRLGYALDAATLQQIAYEHGIQQNINTMTQAQKSQLRYLAIMEQSNNAMGDMARTIATPANSMRILNQQFEQLKRAIGNVVSVFAVKLIPYIQVAIRLLTDLANYLAKKWGFELPEIDYNGSGISSVTDEMSDLADNADTAKDNVSDMVKEVQRLAGFDELNILNKDTEDSGKGSNGAADDISGLTDWNIDLPEYDFLTGLDAKTNELYKKAKKAISEIINKFKDLKKWLDKNKTKVEALALAFGGLWAIAKIKKFYDWLKKLTIIQALSTYAKNFLDAFKASKATTALGKISDGLTGARDQMTAFGKIATGVISGIVGGFAGFDFMKKYNTDTLTWKDSLLDVGVAAGAIGLAFAVGGPIAGGIAVVGTLIGGIAGAIYGAKEYTKQLYDAIINMSDNGGTKISVITQAFVDQYQPLIDLNEKVGEYKATIADNDGTIATASGVLKNYGDNLSGLNGKLTEADITIIKNNFETIAKATKDNIGLETQSVIETFTLMMEGMPDRLKTAMSETVGALSYLQGELSGNVGKAQGYINDYYDAIFNGAEPTAEQQENFNKALDYFEIKMGDTNDKVKGFKSEIAELDLTTIDFEDYDTFTKSMDTLNTTAKEAISSVEQTKKDSLAFIEDLQSEVEAQYKSGFIDESQYKLASETYENARKQITEAAEKNTQQIKDDLGGILAQVQKQYNDFATSKAFEEAKKSVEKQFGVKMPEWNEGQWDLYEERLGEKLKTVQEYNQEYQNAIQDVADNNEINIGDYMDELIKKWDELEWSIYGQKLYNSKTTNELGKYMLEGFNDSIERNSDGTLSTFSGLAGDMQKMWRKAWGINSPSKVTYSYGTYMMIGLKNGIIFTQPILISSILNLTSLMKSTLNIDFTENGRNIITTLNKGFISSELVLLTTLSLFKSQTIASLSFDLTDTGKTIGESFSDGFSSGLTGVVDACNATLRTYESFEIELMNAYNDAVPVLQMMMNGISAVVGAAIGQIDFVSYTTKGRQIAGYASGGYPSRADLFFANENGRPEMVGRIGSRTAVANNDQIIAGIASGVKQAILETGGINHQSEPGGQQGDIYVFIDSEEISYRVERRAAAKAKRTGGG